MSSQHNYNVGSLEAITFYVDKLISLEGLGLCQCKVGGYRILKLEIRLGNTVTGPIVYTHGIVENTRAGGKDELFLLFFTSPVSIDPDQAYTILFKGEGDATF
mmetsp:Transcript_21176/g.9723  ORF Transcript_21176/g.9723 Transcript_21176/m.9723 type:complete len:103 (-) Transcript_21176:118-426(-)